jgi:hypothetical protein
MIITMVRVKKSKEMVCVVKDGDSFYLTICAIEESGRYAGACEYASREIDIEHVIFGIYMSGKSFRPDIDTTDQIKSWFNDDHEWQDMPIITAGEASDAELYEKTGAIF